MPFTLSGWPGWTARGARTVVGVYRVQSSGALVRGHRQLLRRRSTPAASPAVPRTVLLLGLTSLLTDVSSEMVAAVLPLYLVSVAGFAPVAVGVVDGVQRGGAALVALVGGVLGDRTGRHHRVATAGYGTSAVARALLAVGGTAGAAVGGAVLLDRLGKGIRTAPRDAMISLSTPQEDLGTAFGVHRAMDTTGALLGPLIAFALLAAAPGAYGTVWLVSLCAALLGVGVIALLVRPPVVAAPAAPAKVRTLTREVLHDARVRRLAAVAALLGLTATSDAFVYLALRDRVGVGVATFPLLFLGTALVYMALAVPAGRLADRVGRGRVLLGGSALMVGVDALLLAGGGPVTVVLALALLGAGYAATDGVLAALASAMLPEGVRGTGLSVVGTASSASRLLGSVLFGAAWTAFGLTAALEAFAVAVVLALALSASLLRAGRPTGDAARA